MMSLFDAKTYNMLRLHYPEQGDELKDLHVRYDYAYGVTAGTPITYTVPSGKKLILQSYRFRLLSGTLASTARVKLLVGVTDILPSSVSTDSLINEPDNNENHELFYIVNSGVTLSVVAAAAMTPSIATVEFRIIGLLKGGI